MENQEIWKDIEGFEGIYKVSNTGRVKSIKIGKGMIRKFTINKYGYYQVILSNIKRKTCLVHRLVAIAFIQNPENKPEVNHKKGIKIDNRASELEWATHAENIQHSFRELGRKATAYWLGKYGKDNHSSKSVSQFLKGGKLINCYISLSEAEIKTGVIRQSIGKACSGICKTAGGFIWKYTENNY